MQVLITLAVLLGIAGVLLASRVSVGVALVGFACLLAILARIAQADRHHALGRAADAPMPSALPSPPSRPPLQRRPMSRREKQLLGAFVAGVAAILIGIIYFAPESPTLPLQGDPLIVTAAETSTGWSVTNNTRYVWNVCWAERGGARASVPTMMPNATVVVAASAFQKREGTHAGTDLKVFCSYNDDQVARSTPAVAQMQ